MNPSIVKLNDWVSRMNESTVNVFGVGLTMYASILNVSSDCFIMYASIFAVCMSNFFR